MEQVPREVKVDTDEADVRLMRERRNLLAVEYVQERLRAAAIDEEQAGNEKVAAANRMYANEAGKHERTNPGDRKVVAANTPQVCAVDGERWPCGFLKELAGPWRDQDDFPKHLL